MANDANTFYGRAKCGDTVKLIIPMVLLAVGLVFALMLAGCGAKQYKFEGKYYSTSQEGFQVCIEADNHQMRLSSNYNTGPWREYKRDGNTVKVSGMSLDGSTQTLTIEVLSDSSIEAKKFIGGQDVVFRKH